MGNDVKISVIATGFDSSRPLKRIEQPLYRRTVESRPADREVAAVTNGGPAPKPEKRPEAHDLEGPSFLPRQERSRARCERRSVRNRLTAFLHSPAGILSPSPLPKNNNRHGRPPGGPP